MTVDGKDLKVDGKVIGQLGDTVEVKDNELYVNGKATGIKVGKYAILENDADGMYTITLPDANGEMKTIKLPKATSGMMSVNVDDEKQYLRLTQLQVTLPVLLGEKQTKQSPGKVLKETLPKDNFCWDAIQKEKLR